jgi:hypothetical protein
LPILPSELLSWRRGIRLCVSWESHMAMPCVLCRRQCWRLEVSNHSYRPLAMTFRALGVVARKRDKSLGGQHLIVASIPGLSQERCCETTRADFSVAWVPPASPLSSSSARICLWKARASCEAMILASLYMSICICHSPSRSRIASGGGGRGGGGKGVNHKGRFAQRATGATPTQTTGSMSA